MSGWQVLSASGLLVSYLHIAGGPILVSRALSRIPSGRSQQLPRGEPKPSSTLVRVTNQDSQSLPPDYAGSVSAAYHPQSPGQYPRATAHHPQPRVSIQNRRPSPTTAGQYPRPSAQHPDCAGSVSKTTLSINSQRLSIEDTSVRPSAITRASIRTHYPSPDASSTHRMLPHVSKVASSATKTPC